MIISRDTHRKFLEEELRAEVDEFDKKLKTLATHLMLEDGELFTAQFLKFGENGEMIVRLSIDRPLPRKGEYLYCMTLRKELRNHSNWGNLTYGDLIKAKTNYSEVVCVWQSKSDNPKFMLAGFRGVDCEFAEWIKDTPGVVLVMGPNRPPYEYIAHLQELVLTNNSPECCSILDIDFEDVKNLSPTLLSHNYIPSFLESQLELSSSVILQGPPGTGKTYQIASLCRILCEKGASILVTSLTNRAIMEVIGNDSLKDLLTRGAVFKTKISTDEAKEQPMLQLEKTVSPKKGCIVLSTFFISSGTAAELSNAMPFDYVIVDEASQALLAMAAAARIMGKKVIYVGDVKQLAPVVQLKRSRIEEKGYGPLVEGLKSISLATFTPTYQLQKSYRLTERAVTYTGKFYNDTLSSESDIKRISKLNGFFVHHSGGPVLIGTDMVLDDMKSEAAMQLTLAVTKQLLSSSKSLEIAILSCMKQTVRALQKTIFSEIKSPHILIDTVARIQGLTTDVCIYVVPNGRYLRSLEQRLFNVATSRSKQLTIIICDKGILEYSSMDTKVREYLEQLAEDFSFYLPFNSTKRYKFEEINYKQLNLV